MSYQYDERKYISLPKYPDCIKKQPWNVWLMRGPFSHFGIQIFKTLTLNLLHALHHENTEDHIRRQKLWETITSLSEGNFSKV